MTDFFNEMHEVLLRIGCEYRGDPAGSGWASFFPKPELGQGQYRLYFYRNLFAIKIQDVTFYKDLIIERRRGPVCIGIHHLELGNTLHSRGQPAYNRINIHAGDDDNPKIVYHKNMPVHSTGIIIAPECYEAYLRGKFSEDGVNILSAFGSMDGAADFPELAFLLRQIRKFQDAGYETGGEGGSAAKIYYESKIGEVVSLVMKKAAQEKKPPAISVCRQDMDSLAGITAYIDEHFASGIRLEKLSRMACMGTTKLKYTFKQVYRCTITEYIQNKKMAYAERLLSGTDMLIRQIANSAGYKGAGRFSAVFLRKTGLLPNEYRQLTAQK
jgi:AraC-like DNA-binding protein